MRKIRTTVFLVGLTFCFVFVSYVASVQNKKSSSNNQLRAGDEEFHKFRKRQYKIAKKGSTYTKVPMLEIEDATYWRMAAYAELEKQLKIKPRIKMAKNVILFLGDGMSVSTVSAARILKGQKSSKWEHEEMTFDKFPATGFLKTYTTDSQVADSAASATAYLCGVKGNLGTIGVDVNVPKENCTAQQNTNFHTSSALQWFQDSGRSTGFVTTMRVTHATPAGAYAHVADREWEDDHEITGDGKDEATCDDIAEQLILNSPGKNLRVIMGGGRRGLVPQSVLDEEESKKGFRKDGKNLIEEWKKDKKERGGDYAYVWNRNDLLKTDLNHTDFLLGLFAWSHMDYILDRDRTADPSLPEMTKAALGILQRDRDGYFLLVEGGLIDHGHHGNKAQKALTETVEFDEAIQVALEETNPEDTLIIVTADHSHSLSINGYSSRHSDIFGVADYSGVDYIPYTTLLYGNGPGFRKPASVGLRPDPSKEDLHDVNYRQAAAVPEESSTHSGEDVGIWAYGPHDHLFNGVHDQSYVAHALAYAACVGSGPTFCGKNNIRQPSRRNNVASNNNWSRRRNWRG
ncbi:UNVERIFIED_CONTAM: hypothetical protein RMT77_003337 [Armadillidium vulgare]